MRDEDRRPQVGLSLVVRRGDRYLAVLRGRPPYAGTWSFPGGRLEWGETILEGARRELREECGLELVRGRIRTVLDALGEGFHYVLIVVEGEVPPDQEPTPGDDAEACAWLRAEELLARPTPPSVPRLLRQLQEEERERRGRID